MTFKYSNMRYSSYFNRKNKRSGHLWQGRFYSCPLQFEHALEALRYVERNPVRARMVELPWEYEWSSAREHVGFNAEIDTPPKKKTGTDSIIYINVIHTRSYILKIGTPFCKTRPASSVPDRGPVLGKDLRREVRGERFEEREERFLGAERSVIRSDASRPGSSLRKRIAE